MVSVLQWKIVDATTHFTRSNTDTLFPTGLSKEFPSGVKRMLPWRYTVPQMLENWCKTS